MHLWISINIEKGVLPNMSDSQNNKLVYLRAFEMEDENSLIEIRSDNDIFQLTAGNMYFASKEHSKKLLRENLISDGKNLYLMICLSDSNYPIGYVSITDIDHINKKVQWGGIIISNNYSGKGYATSAAKEMLKYIFEELNMNKVYGYWLEDNLASLRMAEKLGFIKEGTLRQHVYKENRYHSVFYLSILRSDYFSSES